MSKTKKNPVDGGLEQDILLGHAVDGAFEEDVLLGHAVDEGFGRVDGSEERGEGGFG